MSKRKAEESAATRRHGRRPGLGGAALALLVLTWTGAPGDLRADTIVLKSGEVLEGSIIDATRNTVIVQPAIGGMRQMPLRDIEEVRIDLAQGQRISGQLLSWEDGIYRVRSGAQVVRISGGDILSREPGETATGEPPRDPAPRPGGPQTVRMAAAPATSAPAETAAARPASAREQTAPQGPEGQAQGPSAEEEQSSAAGEEQSLAGGEEQSPASDEEQSPAAQEEPSPASDEEQSLAAVGEDQGPAPGEDPSPAAGEEPRLAEGEEQSPAAGQDQSPAVGDNQDAATGEDQSPAADEEQSLAALGEDQGPAPGEKQDLAVKASVDPAEPGAANMVFKIELSRPAEQTVVLIYGTVEGTAKAGEDFEPQQGMVTLAPGSKSAEVRVPLIEGSTAQGEKRFELFLAADPKVAEVVDKRIIATIHGGD
jgi:Calx-beta domain